MQNLLLGGKLRKIPAVRFLLDVRYNGVEAILSEDHCCQVVWVSLGRVAGYEIEMESGMAFLRIVSQQAAASQANHGNKCSD